MSDLIVSGVTIGSDDVPSFTLACFRLDFWLGMLEAMV